MNGLSLIIPIYNVEEYIEECLMSVVKSMGDINNIQVILVNDGSNDNSGEIAQKIINNHSNFIYVTKENGGLSDARNYGLKYVKYNYVSFLDSDDYIAENYFSSIFEAMEKQPDMIIFDWLDVGENNNTNLVKGIDLPGNLWTMQPSACSKVFKTSLFNEVKFPKGKVYEDVGTTYKLIYFVRSFTYINKSLYYYRKNRGGSILTTISSKINDIYAVLDETYLFYKSKNAISDENKDGLCYQYVKLLIWSNMYRQLKFYKLNILGFYKKMKQTRNQIYKLFPNWKNNKYINDNIEFFEARLGANYVQKLDNIGGDFFKTLGILTYLIFRNIKRY